MDQNTGGLHPELQLLLDRQEIDLVVTRLYQRIDARDTNHFGDYALPELASGMAQGMQQMMGWACTQHIISDRDIIVEGDKALMRANLIGTSMGPQLAERSLDSFKSEGREQYEVRGRYQFQFARTAGGWRVSNIDVQYLWTTGAPL